MKKFLTFFIAIIMAMSTMLLVACGDKDKKGNDDPVVNPVVVENSGEIAGNYADLDLETFKAMMSIEPAVIPVAEDASEFYIDGDASAKIKLTVGGKKVEISLSEVLKGIFPLYNGTYGNEMDGISALASTTNLRVVTDDGFGGVLSEALKYIIAGDYIDEEGNVTNEDAAAILAMIEYFTDNVNLNAALGLYVKDENVYANARVNGLPIELLDMIPAEYVEMLGLENIAQGIKIFVTYADFYQLWEGEPYPEKGPAPYSAEFRQEVNPEEIWQQRFEDFQEMIANYGIKIQAEVTETTIKLKATFVEGAEEIFNSLIADLLGADGIINNVVISSVSGAAYMELDKVTGEVKAVAANVNASALADYFTGVTITATAEIVFNVKFAEPAITYPADLSAYTLVEPFAEV